MTSVSTMEHGGDLFHDATFMPDDDASRFNALLDTVSTNRYTTFFAVYMEALRLDPGLCVKTGFSGTVLDILGSAPEYRAAFVDDPAFLVWLNLTMRAINGILTGADDNREALAQRLSEFSPLRERFDARTRRGSSGAVAPLRIPGTSIIVQRFDIDPMIMAMTPPSYEFHSDPERRRELERTGYSLSFFHDLARTALDRIKSTWPEEYQQFVRLTKVLGYLPDASFRSCSASRFTGVIYVAAKDNSLLDLEESLVHEGGHQLVYNIVEVAPLTRDDTPEDELYTLPWSGQKRDFYGYFHAFYIYILLVKYFERVRGRPEDEQRRATKRLAYILRGLVKALPDFESNRNFTERGRELFANLEKEVRELEKKHQRLLEEESRMSSHPPRKEEVSAVE